MKKYLPPTLKQTIFLSIKNRYQNSVFSKTSRPSHILPYKTRIHDTTERIFKDRILIPSHVTHSQPTAAHDTPHPLFSQNHCTRSFLSRYYSCLLYTSGIRTIFSQQLIIQKFQGIGNLLDFIFIIKNRSSD